MNILAPSPEAAISDEARLKRRAEIEALEAHMKSAAESDKLPIDDMTTNYFASGVYCRELKMPAGTLVVGKLHKTEHLAVLLSGEVQITTENCTEVLTAPLVMVAPPGTKRVALALTDCTWLAFHAVGEERDLEKIEERFIAKSFADLEALEEQSAPSLENAA